MKLKEVFEQLISDNTCIHCGTIVDEKRKLTSIRGIYFMDEKKYRFISRVKIDDPEYLLNSQRLDYYTESDKAFFYGKTTIVGEEYDIYCEKGAYDTQLQRGNFQENAVIFYDNKEIRGDSLYFENEKNYAAATNNISVIDTLNKSVINGHYGEIFKAKDSAIITRRALAVNIIDKDSLYIHADTLIATGPTEKKILRGYYDVRIFKTDLRGKSDSLHLDQSTGLIKLLKLPLSRKENQILTASQKNKKNPILWFGKSQMSGDKIFLTSDMQTKKLDSLKIIGNSWIIERDSISNTGSYYFIFIKNRTEGLKIWIHISKRVLAQSCFGALVLAMLFQECILVGTLGCQRGEL